MRTGVIGTVWIRCFAALRRAKKGNHMKFWQMFSRALLLRCPSCGKGQIFRAHFRMFSHCECCGRKYDQADGYFLGSIYINYALTALLVAIGYPILVFGYGYSGDVIVWLSRFASFFRSGFFPMREACGLE
jgi:ribosomal protein S27E